MIDADLGADTFMPDLRELEEWVCESEEEWLYEGVLRYRHTTWNNTKCQV